MRPISVPPAKAGIHLLFYQSSLRNPLYKVAITIIFFSIICAAPSLYAIEEQKDDSTAVAKKQEQKKLEEIVKIKLVTVDSSDCPEMYSPVNLLPDSSGVFEKMPEMLAYENPEYPQSAKKAGLIGMVWVKCLVSEVGEVLCVSLEKTSHSPELDQAAINAAWHGKFKPAIQNGRPVRIWVTYPVEFNLTK